MLYHVKANFLHERRQDFLEALTDGSIASIKPEGGEILASMRRAVIRDEHVEWTENCYCSPPLAHERMVVYDQYFTDIETEPIETASPLEGEEFWAYLLKGSREA